MHAALAPAGLELKLEYQYARVLTQLREMILRGEFAAGEKIAETAIAERVAASRTPVRLALAVLEQEGLLEANAAGGFIVRRFSPHEIADAIAVRGLLEGMAARLIAEHGLSRQLTLDLKDCLLRGDRLLAKARLNDEDYAEYIDMNTRFHGLLIEGSGNLALARALNLNSKMPFASADAFLPLQPSTDEGKKLLEFAHTQHHLIVEAIEHGQAVRAQARAEDHAQVAARNLRLALESAGKWAKKIPALRLVGGA